MATIRVQHTIGDLAADLSRIGRSAKPKFAKVVRRNTEQGYRLAQNFAIGSAGPHGKHYYKRITSEMLSPLEGEYGPHAGGTPVGAGYRHGPPNTDLPRSADIQGPKFAKDIGDTLDGLFW
jgi:hypothetical protein